MAKTVILIDDDQDDLDLIKETLKSIDSSILCISFIYPEEALRVVSNDLIFSPDYIFTDINMPGMTGDLVVAELRKLRALDSTVITVLSTSMPTSMVDALIKAGADFALRKPDRIADYQTALNKILEWEKKIDERLLSDRNELKVGVNEVKFKELQLKSFDDDTSTAVYIVDYDWNYLFANAQAKKNAKGYDVTGKNIEDVWKDLTPHNFWHIFQLLRAKADKKEALSLIVTSPLTSKRVKIVGHPYIDCYLFTVAPLIQEFPLTLNSAESSRK